MDMRADIADKHGWLTSTSPYLLFERACSNVNNLAADCRLRLHQSVQLGEYGRFLEER
eukprot:CAMPEP_0194760788 /NCGR_PEP_ID=MMETSP0323_2-20130528/13634_1 /TAXON_ID=2866 ORGANISM="Crypthecodinium cohnii, Strain Seligo" /NCGR_SAMPLE_ID=MMETSP0323_2 /ASSEMBLY_ACC=CAM_ASM_000346 /LENGTH=57 /DNA_ID=CAMNT_0039682237 /DNA_START=81 /DNA_END=250 /DNA_ORIENTATION=+